MVGDDATDDRVNELEALTALQGLDAQINFPELAGTARLFLVPVVTLGGGGDGLPVGDARRFGFHVNVKLLRQASQKYP